MKIASAGGTSDSEEEKQSSRVNPSKHIDTYVDPFGELSSHEYFSPHFEANIDHVISKAKSKPMRGGGIYNAQNIINSLQSFFRKPKKQDTSLLDGSTVSELSGVKHK